MSGEHRRTGRGVSPVAKSGAIVAAGLLAGLGSAVSPQAAGRTERPRLCPQDAPEGVRLPPRDGCETQVRPRPAEADGFRDLGNGVRLRIGGRAGASVDTRR